MPSSQPGAIIVNFGHITAITNRQEAASESGTSLAPEEAAVVARALAALEDEPHEPDVLCAPNDQAAALLQTFLAERALDEGKVEETHAGAREARFDGRDIGWIRAFVPWVRSKLGIANRANRPPIQDTPASLPPQANLAILGDWGTGLYGAPQCARRISEDGDYHALVHLGDVYYSGSEREISDRFLAYWPTIKGAVSRACNSNHEMYSGGGPFFKKTLPAFQQPSTVFTLQNDDWVFVGLDTAWQDHDIDADQVRWLDQIVSGLNGRRLMLLSHHQLFSQLSEQGTKLQRQLARLLKERAIYGWYWGHEHRCIFYDTHPAWGLHARCIGHSGFPYFRPQLGNSPKESLQAGQSWRLLPTRGAIPSARVLDGPNEYIGDRADRYGPNGYLRLELNGTNLNEVVISPDGIRLWERQLS